MATEGKKAKEEELNAVVYGASVRALMARR